MRVGEKDRLAYAMTRASIYYFAHGDRNEAKLAWNAL